jgi:hypothetical protein
MFIASAMKNMTAMPIQAEWPSRPAIWATRHDAQQNAMTKASHIPGLHEHMPPLPTQPQSPNFQLPGPG